MFALTNLYGHDETANTFYQRWQRLSRLPEARYWTPDGFLPTDLSSDEKALAQNEIHCLPEQFHTTFDWLPVITLELYPHFPFLRFQNENFLLFIKPF